MTEVLSVLLAANWGIGEQLLAALESCPGVRLLGVVTRFAPGGEDPWADAVRCRAEAGGHRIWNEAGLTPLQLGELTRSVCADVLWLHAYMKRLPRETFSAPRIGSVNVHASLLPSYRGPSPSRWVLENRESITGITSHFVDEGIDTGPIIHQVPVPVSADDNMDSLLDKLKAAVTPLVLESVRRLLSVDFKPEPQDESRASRAPRRME